VLIIFACQVKTTKPRRYLVRPNQGLVEVGKSTDVTVILQQKDCEELIQSQASLTDSTDKFLVQSAVVADNFFDETSTKPEKVSTPLSRFLHRSFSLYFYEGTN
jgi:predicted amidohydrolase